MLCESLNEGGRTRNELTNSNPTHNNTQRHRPPLFKPDTYQCQTRDVQQARAEPHADALREENLPVRRAQAEHHDAKDDEKVAHVQHRAEVPEIKQRAG